MLHLVPTLSFQTTGGMARLFSSMVIPGGDVVHGPYLFQIILCLLLLGMMLNLIQSNGGGDAFDVYAYLLRDLHRKYD